MENVWNIAASILRNNKWYPSVSLFVDFMTQNLKGSPRTVPVFKRFESSEIYTLCMYYTAQIRARYCMSIEYLVLQCRFLYDDTRTSPRYGPKLLRKCRNNLELWVLTYSRVVLSWCISKTLNKHILSLHIWKLKCQFYPIYLYL